MLKNTSNKSGLPDDVKGEEIEISELRYRRLFETARDGVLLIEFDTGMIFDVNPFLIEMLGYSKEDFLKKHLWEIGVFKDVAASKENFLTLQEKRYVRFENLPLETKAGKKVNVEFVANAYKVGSETVIQCNIRDITDRKQAEDKIIELKERDEAILSSIGDAVFASDKEGKILLFNNMAEEITGISAEEAIGNHYDKIISFTKEDDGRPANDFIGEAIKNNKETKRTNHVMLLRKDGRSIPVDKSAAPIMNAKGEAVGSVVVFHDVTKERQIDKDKTDFISLASHQLKNPITAISWNLETLLCGDHGPLSKEQKEVLERIYESNKSMSELVGGFISVTKMESSGFFIEEGEVSLDQIFDAVLEELAEKISEKNISVTKNYGDGIPRLNIGPKAARIIIENLITNAIKYTGEKGIVELEIRKIDEGVSICVKDNGYGIPEDAKSKIFTKLFRADNIREKEPSGTGLGLYLIKSLIDKLGGRIWFESKEGIGTTFNVNFKETCLKN